MPKTVEFPELGAVDFPDEMSWDEVNAAITDNHSNITASLKSARIQQMEAETVAADPPTASDKFVQTIRSIGKGAIRGAAGIPKLIGEVSAGVNRLVYDGGEPGTVRSGDPKDLLTYQAGKALEDSAETASPDVPGLEGSFLFTDVPSGIGQVGGALATGGAVKGAVQGGLGALGVKAAAKIGADVAVTSTLSQMAASEFDDAYQRSVERGDSQDLALGKATAYSVFATAVEAKLGVGRLAKRFGLAEPTKEALEKTAKEGIAKATVKELTAGFTEEALQRAAQDFIVDGAIDINAVVREGGAGGLVQALLGGLAHSQRRGAAKQTLDWISDRQAKGMTIDEMKETGLKMDTLQELGIPVRIDKVEGDGDFNLPGGEASAPAAAAQAEVAPSVSTDQSQPAPTTGLTVEDASKHMTKVLGSKLPSYVEVYSTPGEVSESGGVVKGSNFAGKIRLNVGNIESTDDLEAVLLHEGFHTVEQMPEVKASLEALQRTLTPKQIEETLIRGYSEQEAPVEAVARMLEQEHLDGKQRSAWERVWATVRTALQTSLGWAGVRFQDVDARRILASSMRRLRADATVDQRGASETIAPVAQSRVDAPLVQSAVQPSVAAQPAPVQQTPGQLPTVPPPEQPRFSLGEPRGGPVRQHTEQLNASIDIDDTIKERIRNYLYERRNNKNDAAFAAELVAGNGPDRAEHVFRDQSVGMPEAVRTMIGHAVIKAWGQLERQARMEGRTDQANRIADRTAAFIDNDVLPRSTEIAQALQAFSVFSYLTPSGWIATTKRIIETARGNVLADMVKPVKEIAGGMRQINEETLAQLPNAADVQAATVDAVDQTIEADSEVNQEIRKEASKAFGNLAGIVITQFSGQSKETLAARLKAELQISDEEAAKLAKRVERKWASEVERYKRGLKKRTAEQRTLWQRYQNLIATTVAAQVKVHLAKPNPKGALEVFSSRVASALGAQVRAALPAKAPGKPELTDIQVIGEALKNPEKYREAWARVVSVLQSELVDQPGVLQQLEEVFAQDPELIAPTRLDGAIASKLKALRFKIGDTVKRHFLERSAVQRRLADSLIKDAGVQGEAALTLAARISSRFAKLAEEKRRKLLAQMAKDPNTARVVKRKTTQERLIELANLGGFDDAAALEAVSESLGLPSLTAEAKAEIVKRADALQQMPEGSNQRGEATVQIMNFIARQKGLSWWELPMAFWYANTLSGPITHAVNAASNLLSLGGNVASVLAHNPTAIGTATSAIYRGFVQGGREARSILGTGVSKAASVKMESQGPLELMQDSDLKGAGKILKHWRYVGRMLSATDQLFYAPAKEVKAAVLARGLAKREGLKGQRLAARVREILGNDTAAKQLAKAQATTEGLTGLAYARRVDQIMEAQRPETIREDAHEFALLTTFNGTPYGLLGAIADGFNMIHRKAVVTRMVVPFVNVVANVTNETLNYSPVGFGRAAWAHWNVRTKGQGRIHGRDITSLDTVHDAYAKASLGLLATGALLALAAAGAGDDDYWFAISGAGPVTPDQRKALRATGWIPHSLRIGKRYWSYANTPLAVPLAIVGNYLDALKYRKLEETDILNRVAFAVGTAGNVVVQQSYLDNVAQLLGSLDHVSARSADQRAVDVVSRSVTTLAIPQALRQIDRVFDPAMTEPGTVVERVVAQIPFARRNLKPALNSLGEPVVLSPASRFTSAEKGDEIWTVLSAKQAWPSVPDQGYFTPEEHYSLVELRGTLLKGALVGALPRIAAAPPDEAKRIVSSLSGEATLRAKATLGLDRVERLRKLEAP